ncbi:MAG TPA: AAA family ATPase, partial [Anaeromyxobacteraceae bacterium]|nr:AAA family ATPase [Anaeromyxobacteraceae bacterium]
MTPVVQEIAELWSAGTPVVYVVTPEEDRAVALCQAAGEAFDAKVGVWTSHRGLVPFAPHAKDPIAMLDALVAAPAPVLAVALDFHHALENHAVARKLRDLLPRLAAEGRCLAVVAPRLVLPDGLASDVAVVRLPLPDEAELASLLDGVRAGLAAPRTPPLDPDVRHRALVAGRGLTEAQARRAFSRALRGDAALGPEAIAAIVAEKERLLARDLGLELVEAGEG